MMSEEQRDMWVAALRSGEYKQGSGGYFSTNEEFCAMGVLFCTLRDRNIFDRMDVITYGMHEMQYLFSHHIRKEIIHLNDVNKLDFFQIADWIEKNIPVTPTNENA